MHMHNMTLPSASYPVDTTNKELHRCIHPDMLPVKPIHATARLEDNIPSPPLQRFALLNERCMSKPPEAFHPGDHHRFFTSEAHPSIPSPLLPTGMLRLTCSIPLVSAKNGLALMPPALALSTGNNANMGIKNLAMLSASSLLKWYFSFNTSGNAQCLKR